MGKLNFVIMIGLTLAASMSASAAITHRFDFEADPNDVVGGLATVLENGAVVQGGELVLAGGASPAARAVLDAPGIGINGYTEGVTVETWFTDNSLSGWTRVFDFGDTSGGDGGYYWFYTPSGPGNSRLVIATNGFPGWQTGEQLANGPVLAADTQYHIVCIYDPTGGDGGNPAMRIYQDAVEVGFNVNVTMPLSDVSNSYAYLGSAVYPGDPELTGSIAEFRIHNKVLDSGEIQFSNHFGADDAYPLVIRSRVPAYGTTFVSTTPTLSWAVEPDITAVSYTLYLGSDPNIADPNKPDVSGFSDLVKTGLTSPTYTVLAGEALANGTDYYWRVDTTAADTTVYQGAGSMFATIPAFPAFTSNPGTAGVFLGQDIVLTASCESLSPLTDVVRWYKAGTPDAEITTADPEVLIEEVTNGSITTSTLTIHNATLAREGRYYAAAANMGGTGTSANGSVVIKRLLARYEFEGNAEDSSGSGLHGTILTPSGAAATATYVASTLPGMGQAISFTGTGISNPSNATDPYVDLPDGFSDFTQGLTISAWAYPTSNVAWQRICQFGNGTNGANNSLYFTRVGTGSTLRFENDNTNPSNVTSITTGNDGITLNEWQHLVITLNANAANNAVIYRNGLPVTTGTITLPNVVTRTNCYIGRSEWYGDYLFRGQMDDVQIYNYDLSADDIAELYSDVAGPFCQVRPTYDLNDDCLFNLSDIAMFAAQWFECGLYPVTECP